MRRSERSRCSLMSAVYWCVCCFVLWPAPESFSVQQGTIVQLKYCSGVCA